MRSILTGNAPTPRGHYSQAVIHNGLVYVAGQLGIDPANPQAAAGSVEAQTERALRNVEGILLAAGSSLDLLVSVTIYISDMSLWGQVNQVYARILGEHRPARAVVPVKEFRDGLQVEIQAIAAVG